MSVGWLIERSVKVFRGTLSEWGPKMSQGVRMVMHSPSVGGIVGSALASAATVVFSPFSWDPGNGIALCVASALVRPEYVCPDSMALSWVIGFCDLIHPHPRYGLHSETFHIVTESS